jgi:hypothetical protein
VEDLGDEGFKFRRMGIAKFINDNILDKTFGRLIGIAMSKIEFGLNGLDDLGDLDLEDLPISSR